MKEDDDNFHFTLHTIKHSEHFSTLHVHLWSQRNYRIENKLSNQWGNRRRQIRIVMSFSNPTEVVIVFLSPIVNDVCSDWSCLNFLNHRRIIFQNVDRFFSTLIEGMCYNFLVDFVHIVSGFSIA